MSFSCSTSIPRTCPVRKDRLWLKTKPSAFVAACAPNAVPSIRLQWKLTRFLKRQKILKKCGFARRSDAMDIQNPAKQCGPVRRASWTDAIF